MKKIIITLMMGMVCSAAQAVLITDNFNRANTTFATNNAQIAVSIGSNWKTARTDDTNTQYRIFNNEVDMGVVSAPLLTKAMLLNTAAGTINAGAATNFTLSADINQYSTNSTSYAGLVFNYQDGGAENGSYYLFRVGGNGAAQFLVFSNFVQQAGSIVNKAGAVSYVSNHVYTYTVSSVDPYIFNISVFDKTTSTMAYTTNNVTVGGTFKKLQDGLGGMYATSGLATFDNFSLDAVPEPATIGMLGVGALAVMLIRRMRR
ncbi:MAG: PEP-CTERM sorting domain-containing protein [Kiritimatiellaceae bacterium]|nr:PEP-CTERM sorting domain-containing protein [Kiritimatiellaceae bacterium]